MNQDRIDELLALAALGELSDADETELDGLLGELPDVASELRADLGVAAALQGIHAEQPSDDLRARVLAEIEGVEQDPGPATITDLGARRKTRPLRRWLPTTAAAAAAVLIVGGAFAVVNRNGAQSPTQAVIEASDADEHVFGGGFEGRLVAVESANANAIVIDGADLGALGSDQTYQLWLIDGDAIKSVGTFRPEASGDVSARFDDVAIGSRVLAVTIEPAGGSESPTLPIVATAV